MQSKIGYVEAIWLILLLGACGTPEKTANDDRQAKKEKAQLVAATETKKMLFFGNSITAGYGLDTEEAFPAVIQSIMDSLQFPYLVINAGLSGETSSGGLNRIDWVLKTVPDVFVLELGANDGLRGLDLNETEKNLISIIQKVKIANPEVLAFVAGMEVPPNLGVNYTGKFRDIFPKVAEATGSFYIPFILKKVAGEPNLNLPDGIHPTAEGHQMVGEYVWSQMAPHLKQAAL